MVHHAVPSVAHKTMPLASLSTLNQSHSLTPDIKRSLIAAVAQELHRLHGGNAMLDWLEAELLVEEVLESHQLS